jgi:uncharacterized protein YraI
MHPCARVAKPNAAMKLAVNSRAQPGIRQPALTKVYGCMEFSVPVEEIMLNSTGWFAAAVTNVSIDRGYGVRRRPVPQRYFYRHGAVTEVFTHEEPSLRQADVSFA